MAKKTETPSADLAENTETETPKAKPAKKEKPKSLIISQTLDKILAMNVETLQEALAQAVKSLAKLTGEDADYKHQEIGAIKFALRTQAGNSVEYDKFIKEALE